MNSAPLESLIRLRNAADVLRVSHANRFAAPLATELLREQHRFNTEVAELCIDWVTVANEKSPQALITQVLGVEHSGPVRSHRPGIQGVLITNAKRLLLETVSPVVKKWQARQLEFNNEVTSLLVALAQKQSVDAEAVLNAQRACTDQLRTVMKRMPPLAPWLEKQTQFNELLASVMINHRHLLISSHAQAYHSWRAAGEPSTLAPAAGVYLRWAIAFRHAPTARCEASLPWNDDSWSVVDDPRIVLSEELKARGTELPLSDVDAVLVLDGTEVLRTDRFARWSTAAHADLWFADSDVVDVGGLHSTPHFRTAFSPVSFSERDTVGTCIAMNVKTFEGLKAQQRSASATVWNAFEQKLKILNVREVLWARSTGQNLQEHAEATARHWAKTGAHFSAGAIPAVTFPVPEGIKASLIIPFRDKVELLEQLMKSLTAFPPGMPFELILISNNSQNTETFKYVNSLPVSEVRLLEWNHPFNWSQLNNLGAKNATGDVLVFLNNDVECTRANWLRDLAGYALRPDIGPVGPVLQYPDGTIQHSGVVIGVKGLAGHIFRRWHPSLGETAFGSALHSREVSAVTGACIAIERSKFEALGGFDERIAISGGDVEWCLRSRSRSLRCVSLGGLGLVHHESISRGAGSVPTSDIAEELKAYAPLLSSGDPWFHPALSTASTAAVPWLDGETAAERAERVAAHNQPGVR